MNTRIISFFKLSAACFASTFLLSIPSQAAKSLSQRGITWTFSEDRPTGQFANGDYWVQFPVTITSITPETAGGGGGSMINLIPGQANGLSSAEMYDPAKNIGLQLPYLLESSCSLVSTIAATDWTYKTYFKEIAVLTILASPPPDGSFRPPYAGNDKTISTNWNLSSMSLDSFRKIDAPNPAHIPDRVWLEAATVRPLLEYSSGFTNSNWKASDNEALYPRRTYGREISNISAAAGLYLNLDFDDANKRKLLINVCQWGIDTYGLINAGMQWLSNGGHQHGRKIPLFLAAKALNDHAMLAKCNAKNYDAFQEDTGHWFITQQDIDTPRSLDIKPYTQDMLGMPEWGPGAWERTRHGPDWELTGYRFINGGPNCAAVACVILMGGQADYGNDAYFRYIIDRYFPKQKIYGGGTVPNYNDNIQPIVVDLWDHYILGIADSGKLQRPKGLKVVR